MDMAVSEKMPAPDAPFTLEEWQRALDEKESERLRRAFARASVAILGAGGLGSNIAVMLARAGVGRLHVIDFDRIEITNLNRQQFFADQIGMPKALALKENLARIAPYCEVRADVMKIDETKMNGLFDGADIICEAFDKAEAKALLADYVLENHPDKYLISGSGMAGTGPANEMVTKRITSHFFICGDGRSDVDDNEALLGTRVMLCAAHQAHQVLRIIAEAE